MIHECKLDAESTEEGNNASRTQHVQGTTVHTLLGHIKACQMAARVEASLYREKELSNMREISVVRSEVRFMVRTKNKRDVKNCADRRRGTIGDTYTAEQFRQIMMKALTLLSHHTLLRGASIREITLPDIFLYRLASTSLVNPENQPVVMVIAVRNSKTSKDARLQQSYAAQHLEVELYAVGETGLWLHFILDQIGQFNGVDFLPPLDTTECERWYKKHLFFARNDKEQKELSAASHQHWMRQMWTTNKVFCKRNVHAARTGGAQELAIEGTPRAEIAELGHWALDKMTRAYITTIPVGVVMRKAGYSGCKQDYFLGRRRVEPSDKLLDIIAEHIFPGVDALLRDEISVRLDTEYHNMSLKEMLKYERERSAVKKIDLQEEIEKRDDTIATLTAEITRLTEALSVSDAWRMPAAPPSGNEQAPSESGSADFARSPSRDSSTLLKGATQGAHDMKVRRMLKAMDAVRLLRSSDGDADTEGVITALNKIAAPGIGTFCDALTVLKPGSAQTKSKEPGMGVKGLGPKSVSKLRLACALVAVNLKPSAWVAVLFPDT
ncbi:unnamed protein product [Closterium sp. Naga37s-1]|nr:unnamed protein product [Closterium sp. Naga37s-1]